MSRVHQAQLSKSEVAQLRARLAEAEETLSAIRKGDVDAIAVEGPHGRQIFTLQSADQPYRILAESMNEGAASMTADGTILFCNERLTHMVGLAPEKLVGSPVTELVVRGEQQRFQQLLASGLQGEARAEVQFQRADGSLLPVLVSLKAMPAEPELGLCLVATDLTELRCVEEALRRSEARLRLQFERMPFGCVVWNKEFRVESWNPAAEKIFGFPAAEVLGKHPYETIVPRELQQQIDVVFRRLLEGDSTALSTNQNLTKDGRSILCEWINTPLKDVNGEVVGAFSMVQDITERKRAEEALEQKTEELVRSNEELSQFAYVASHDLQEPLRKIMAFGDRLTAHSAAALDQSGRDYLERMQSAADRMGQLIDSLLQLSRVTTRGASFEPVDLNKVVAGVLEDMELRLQQTRGHLQVAELPTVLADRSQMRQLFQNLLGNALKFHREGLPPVVQVRAQPDEKGGWEIHVRDNGIGFEEKYVDRIFRPFQRLNPRSAFDGCGIGLAICDKIMARHSGQITAHSQLGGGSEFVLTFPAGSKVKEAKACGSASSE